MNSLNLFFTRRKSKQIFVEALFNEKGQLIFETSDESRLPDGSIGPMNYKHLIIVETDQTHMAFKALNIPEDDKMGLLIKLRNLYGGYGAMRQLETFLAENCIYFTMDFYNAPINKYKMYKIKEDDYFEYDFE